MATMETHTSLSVDRRTKLPGRTALPAAQTLGGGMKRLRVVLADDHVLVRAGLRKLLESMPDLEVVGEADDGLAVLTLVEQLNPNLVLLDIAMPKLNGLEVMDRLRKAWPEINVLIISMYQNEGYVSQALSNGASGYLLKSDAATEFNQAIDTIRRGEIYLSSAVTKGVLTDYVKRLRNNEASGDQLTPRQREVLQLVAQGQSTKEIAHSLGLSSKTVDTHRSQLMKQLDIHDAVGLVRYALRTGLISVD